MKKTRQEWSNLTTIEEIMQNFDMVATTAIRGRNHDPKQEKIVYLAYSVVATMTSCDSAPVVWS